MRMNRLDCQYESQDRSRHQFDTSKWRRVGYWLKSAIKQFGSVCARIQLAKRGVWSYHTKTLVYMNVRRITFGWIAKVSELLVFIFLFLRDKFISNQMTKYWKRELELNCFTRFILIVHLHDQRGGEEVFLSLNKMVNVFFRWTRNTVLRRLLTAKLFLTEHALILTNSLKMLRLIPFPFLVFLFQVSLHLNSIRITLPSCVVG